MENPVRYLEEKNGALARTLGETGGLGTVATRADIIEKLFHTFLLEKKGSEILITSKARQLLKLVPEDLKKPELTARWELQLSRMAKGELKREEFMKKIREYAKDLIREIRTEEGVFRHEKYHRQDLPPLRQTAAGGKRKKREAAGVPWIGSAATGRPSHGLPTPAVPCAISAWSWWEKEKAPCLSAPAAIRKSCQNLRSAGRRRGAGVTKRDVARYLAKQKEAEKPVNNSFAEALKNIKLS